MNGRNQLNKWIKKTIESIHSKLQNVAEEAGNVDTIETFGTVDSAEPFENDKASKSGKSLKKLGRFSKIKQSFCKLRTGKKVQVVIAMLLTAALLIILPVYAWFVMGKKLEAFTKIKEPDNLDIRAGHYDAVQYFSLNDIDIESVAKGTPHRVVFSVSAGDYKIPYQIQLAHTTNIPFSYKLYRATEYTSASDAPDVTYVSMPLKNEGKTPAEYTFYYKKNSEIELTAKNPDADSMTNYGRQLALGSGKYYDNTYNESDTPEIYAVPIYEQTGKITTDIYSEHDYFILEISWDAEADKEGNFKDWNAPENKKETDIIHLTASRYTQ